MRISTSFSFAMNSAAMQSKQAEVYQLQEQIATGRRIVTPSDDPMGATHVLETSNALARSENNVENINAAQVMLKGESITLDAVRNVLNSARNVAVGSQGVTGTQTRTDFANFLEQVYQDLLGYANSVDTNGNFMFSGSKGSIVPFQQVSGVADYQGDSGQQNVAISSTRQIPVRDSGDVVFGVGTADEPFAVIDQLITDLRDNTLTGAAFNTAVETALQGLTNATDNIVRISNQVAVRTKELQAAKDAESNFILQFKNEIDRVESVDIQKVAVELQFEQVSLQATQQAFVNASKLTLFNYL